MDRYLEQLMSVYRRHLLPSVGGRRAA